MLYLSRAQIEAMAETVIQQYLEMVSPQKRLFCYVDISELAEMLGFTIDYQYLSEDGTILGMTASQPVSAVICDLNRSPMVYDLDGRTILIEQRLLHPSLVGRRNFTIAHELAHQIINRTYPEEYAMENRVLCDYRRTEQHKKIADWHEWQADALGAALLLPREAVTDAMFLHGLGKKMTVLSRKYSESRYRSFWDMAEYLQVSRTALAYRMEQLGLLERNLLAEEAQKRREAKRHGSSDPQNRTGAGRHPMH